MQLTKACWLTGLLGPYNAMFMLIAAIGQTSTFKHIYLNEKSLDVQITSLIISFDAKRYNGDIKVYNPKRFGMPIIDITFMFLDAAKQPTQWTPANQSSIANLGLDNVDFENPNQITGKTRNKINPSKCDLWTTEFKTLDVAFHIFSDAAGNSVVTVNGATCIGAYVAANAVTLYVETKPVATAVVGAVGAAAVAPGAVGALATQAQITTYLGTQQHIRVYIPASLSRGHQTTTCLIIRRLIEIGYTNAFEVIYVDNNNNADTIKTLLPELNITLDPANQQQIQAGNYQSAALGNCVFTFTDTTAGPPANTCQLGISGGVDDTQTNPKPICNVDYFLMLQPFQWNAANNMYVTRANTPATPNPIDLSKEKLLDDLKFTGCTCYSMDTTAITWVVAAPEVAKMPAAAQPAINGIQNNCIGYVNYHLLPVYGLAQQANPATSQGVLSNWPNLTQMSAFANLVLGVLTGQAASPLNRATVIMTMDRFSPTWNADLLEQLPEPYHARIKFFPDTTAAVPAAWNDTMITTLNANEILIVNFPGIPSPLFNYFYLNSSLPPIFEGKGTMPVMLNSGRPYLQLSKQATGFDTVRPVTPLPPAPAITSLKVFLYPWIPYLFGPGPLARSEKTQGEGSPRVQMCFAAGNALVKNDTQIPTTIDAHTFPSAVAAFSAIQAYLQTNFYIDSNNRVLNKFKALLNAVDFETANFPIAITKAQMYADLQAACTNAQGVNRCAVYQSNIAVLSAFFGAAITPANQLPAYFTGLRTYFNNPANDKFIKGMGFAVSAINVGL